MGASRWHRAAPLMRLAALAVIGAAFWRFCGFMRHGGITNDWPWLYHSGLAIWANGLPAHDTLSWTFPARDWVLYQWLFEAVAAPLYGLAGPTASIVVLCVFGFGLYAGAPAWYLARRGVSPWITLVAGSLVLLPVGVNFSLRPMLATLVLMAAQWVWLMRLRAGRIGWRVAAVGLAAGYALWANLHLGFTLGLVSLGLLALTDLDRLSPRRFARGLTAWATRWLGLAGVSVAATGANPYGWSLFGYMWRLSHKSAMNAHIHELMPPDITQPVMQLALGLATVLVLLCVWAWRRGLRLPGTALLHVAVFAAMTSQALRMIVWAGLAYVVAVAPLIQALWASYRPRMAEANSGRGVCRDMWAVAILVLVIAGPASAWLQAPVRVADCGASAPAIRRLDTLLPADAHWFSSERVGSCTALVAPGRRVFIDTRFDFYPQAFVLAWFQAYQHRADWRGVFKRWDIQYVLLAEGAPLVRSLGNAPEFSKRRLDNHMWLFTRRPVTPGA